MIIAMIKKHIITNLEKIVSSMTNTKTRIDLEQPEDLGHGDYTTTIALKLGKIMKKNPLEIAQEIVTKYPRHEGVSDAEAIKPGFINFWIAEETLLATIRQSAETRFSFPQVHLGKRNKIMIEYAHPNTHKLFHIGHLRNITIGEAIVRMFEATGNILIRSNYQGDVGLHIAKCLYAVRNNQSEIKKLTSLREKIRYLGKAYSEGQKAYDKDEKTKNEINEINRMIYNQDESIVGLWKETRQWSLDYFDAIYKRLYSRFDRLYFESENAKRGVEIVHDAIKKGILEKSEGAIIFNGKKYGVDTRVFINSLGFPTYEGKELALAEKEFSEFGELDTCIHLTTPEQKSFFNTTFKVEELLNPSKFKDRQFHLTYEWVQLRGGKMSSRQGNVVEGEWLIDETKKKINELFGCSEDVAETLAVAAVKYSFLKNSVSNTIVFDINESVSLEGNSGPYLLYSYVRCHSVLEKTKDALDVSRVPKLQEEETALFRTLYQFPEVVGNAASNFAPNYIATYLFNITQQFNLFYQKCPILKADGDAKTFRLLLTKATAETIKKGLDLLGIKTVNKM